MARPRKPTNVLRLSGAFDKDPQRGVARANEPQNLECVGEPPERLNDQQLKAWNEIIENSPYGVLTKGDRHTLELTSVLLTEFWVLGANMKGTHMSMLNTLLAKMGMNPSDRSRVTAQNSGKENPFSSNGRR